MKTTTKRVFSLFLTLVMALGLCTVGAFADHVVNGTITVYDANNDEVPGTYTTITAAAAAAGTNGRVVLSAGTFAYDCRQIITANGLTLQGAGIGQTIVTTAPDFATNLSVSDRKALLTIAGTDDDNPIVVTGITFDGGTYGSTLTPTGDEGTQFNVVRVNTGAATLNNVRIMNSNRTLLSVGTSTTSATVTATGLYCEGAEKTITNNITYADISIVQGSFTLGSGSVVNAFISTDPDYSGTFVNSCTANHYTLTYDVIVYTYELTSTMKHFVESYVLGTSWIEKWVYATGITDNLTVVHNMVTEAVTNVQTTHSSEDIAIATNFRAALNDAKIYATSSEQTTINSEIARLDAVLT